MNPLERGDTGPGVEKLQQDLIEQGFSIGDDAKDKMFGRDTYNAVCMFQASHLGKDGSPLKADGVVGEKTLWALEHPSSDVHQVNAAIAAPADVPAQGLVGRSLAAALSELRAGVKETPDGSNRSDRIDKYTGVVSKDLAKAGPPWCAYFVSWCVNQGANGKGPFGTIGNAQNIGLWAKKRGLALIPGAAILRPGDIFIIARDEVHGHCGFVRSVTAGPGGTIWTVEGNAGNAVRSHQRKVADLTTVVRLPDA